MAKLPLVVWNFWWILWKWHFFQWAKSFSKSQYSTELLSSWSLFYDKVIEIVKSLQCKRHLLDKACKNWVQTSNLNKIVSNCKYLYFTTCLLLKMYNFVRKLVLNLKNNFCFLLIWQTLCLIYYFSLVKKVTDRKSAKSEQFFRNFFLIK